MTEHHDSEAAAKRAVIAALIGNTGVAAAKLVAFLFTGSAAMLAEFYHSSADTINQGFLLLGMRLEKRAPNEKHPFGYSRERYFWAFVVAVSIFGLGAVLSIIEGASKISHPHEIRNPIVSFIALGVAFVFETYALRIAWREFQHWRDRNPGPLLTALRTAKAPTILVVIFEDSAALAGILVAAGGISLTLLTGNGVYDAIASLLIGVILIFAAGFIGMRSRALLLGEAATDADRARIRSAVEGVSQVGSLLEMLTLHLGPEDILINLNIEFADDLRTDDIEAVIDEIERRIREAVPAAGRIFIEAESLRGGAPLGSR